MITDEQYKEIMGALISLHNRLDTLERKSSGSWRTTPSMTILLSEIRAEAIKTLQKLDFEQNRPPRS